MERWRARDGGEIGLALVRSEQRLLLGPRLRGDDVVGGAGMWFDGLRAGALGGRGWTGWRVALGLIGVLGPG